MVLRLVETGLVRVAFSLPEHSAKVTKLAMRYADRQPDLADLCLVLLSELHPKHPVITLDGDFHIYRRHEREIIPLLMPPELSR